MSGTVGLHCKEPVSSVTDRELRSQWLPAFHTSAYRWGKLAWKVGLAGCWVGCWISFFLSWLCSAILKPVLKRNWKKSQMSYQILPCYHKNPKTDWKRISTANVRRCQQILTRFFIYYALFSVVIKLLSGGNICLPLFKISPPENNGMNIWTVAKPPYYVAETSCLKFYLI